MQPTYDAVGNVASVTTSLGAIPGVTTGGSETQAFCYDEQDRLTWASTQGSGPCGRSGSEGLSGAGYTASYSYDPVGRIASQAVTTSGGGGLTGAAQGSYTYGESAHVHAVTAVGSGGTPSYSAAYDAAGDMTCRALGSYACNNPTPSGQTLTYDALRRLASWQNGSSSSEQYAYDGEGNRVWRQTVSGSTTTTTVSILGVEDVTAVSGAATTATRYYSLPGGVTATRDGSGLVYEATDALGTPIAALNLSTGIVGEQLRAPYGQARYAANGTGSGGGMRTPYGFTGQREDTQPTGSSGLDDFNARMYDAATGRFTSADDVQPGLGDPSGQDNYAYVDGMVEQATDPTGHAYAEDMLGAEAENGKPVTRDVTHYININATEQGGGPGMLGFNGSGMAESVGTAMGNGVSISLGDGVTANFDGDGGATLTGPKGTVVERTEDVSQIAGPDPLAENQAGVHDAALDETPPASGAPKPPGGPDTPPGGPHGPDTPPTGGDTRPATTGDSNPLEGCSFSAETPVATPGGGERAMGSLRVGETVEAYNPATGQAEAEAIQHVWVNHDSDLVDVRVAAANQGTSSALSVRAEASGHGWLVGENSSAAVHLIHKQQTANTAAGETIHTTANHPWLTADRGWVAAGDLRPGEALVTLGGGAGIVVWVHVVPGAEERYNLAVTHDHTYAVGAGLWVVHNTCTGPAPTDKLQPGPFAGGSIPARGPKSAISGFTDAEHDAIDAIGYDTGCHTCGTKNPGPTGHFIPDHQPPDQLNANGAPQRLYPHCSACSHSQGGQVRQVWRMLQYFFATG